MQEPGRVGQGVAGEGVGEERVKTARLGGGKGRGRGNNYISLNCAVKQYECIDRTDCGANFNRQLTR